MEKDDIHKLDRYGRKRALFWEPLDGNRVQCTLCKHHCRISDGKVGICGVRKNIGGKLHAMLYGKVSSSNPDPIEKKPLFHFHPGTSVLTFGGLGCNLNCAHCQNPEISRGAIKSGHYKETTCKQIASQARKWGCPGVAWSYNEPTIWYEFNYECSKEAKKNGLYTVYVTNGYMEEDPLRELAPYLDAANIDVKGFTEGFYKKICNAKLQNVLDSCVLHKELGIHIELTYLVIPGHNDSKDEISQFTKWSIENLGPEVPLHFTRFHPDHRMMSVPATPLPTLDMAWETARELGARYVYLGNIFSGHRESTYCPHCEALVVGRKGYKIGPINLRGNSCKSCGKELNFVNRRA